jgi:hypothetical protein
VITQHLAKKRGGDILTGGVILFHMIDYKGMILEGEMIEMIIEATLESMPSTLHQSDILIKGGEIHQMHGEHPKGQCRQGEHPRGDFSQGEQP